MIILLFSIITGRDISPRCQPTTWKVEGATHVICYRLDSNEGVTNLLPLMEKFSYTSGSSAVLFEAPLNAKLAHKLEHSLCKLCDCVLNINCLQ